MNPAKRAKKVLMVDDNPGDVRLVQYMLSETTQMNFELISASKLSAARGILDKKNDIDLILLDMMLPDAAGFDSLINIRTWTSDVPIIMLSTIDDEDMSVQAVQLGAQDFLVKSYLTAPLLVRALRYALERDVLQKHLYHLNYLAHHDHLTGLPNRAYFQDRITNSISWSRRHQRPLVLMLLDMNDFKAVNDNFGHQAGDLLLTEVALRLRSVLRETDCVARLGGDEFALILGDVCMSADAEIVAKKIQNVMVPDFLLNGQKVNTSVSIGISQYPEDGLDFESLVMSADRSMYKAKLRKMDYYGLSGYEFSSVLNDSLSQGVKGHSNDSIPAPAETVMSYQPIVAIDDGLITGVEIFMPQLASPTDTLKASDSADQFIFMACREVKKWQQSGFPELKLIVSVSATHFKETGFVSHIKTALEETGLDVNSLELAFTEDLLIENELLAVAILNKLSTFGVGLILDNFGQELSPLSYLKRFPINSVRISPYIIKNVPIDLEATAMFEAIISMTQILKLKCIIKGVENEGQLTFFRSRGCKNAQGNILSPPLIDLDCTELLSNQRLLMAKLSVN